MSDNTITGIDIHTYSVEEPARAMTLWRQTMGLHSPTARGCRATA